MQLFLTSENKLVLHVGLKKSHKNEASEDFTMKKKKKNHWRIYKVIINSKKSKNNIEVLWEIQNGKQGRVPCLILREIETGQIYTPVRACLRTSL